MGVQAAAVHLPAYSVDGKRAREAGLARGFTSLRVADWDEDPFTMALEAGVQLAGDELEGVERVRLFLDEPTEQAGLAARVLDVDVPVSQTTGRASLAAELTRDPREEELWLAGGGELGAAGVALRIGADGASVTAAESLTTAPLDAEPGAFLAQAFDRLDPDGGVDRRTPPGLADRATLEPRGLAVGSTGAAAPALELAAHLDEAQSPVLLGAVGDGQAHAVAIDATRVPVRGLERPGRPLDPERYRQRERYQPEPWAQASQGAYVSPEVYDHDPERRYGARSRGPGEVLATTTIEGGPPGEFARQHEAWGPYDVVVVDLDEGGREIGQAAVPPGRLAIGDRVRPVLRCVFTMEGEVRYGLKWRHVSET